MTRVGRISAIIAAALSTAACASFDGMPRPVIEEAAATNIPDRYRMATVLERMDTLTNPTEKRELRNRTVAIYLAAADARYQAFRVALARDMKGTNLGLDLAIAGLTSVGSIAKDAANELSAAASGLAGARGAVNKELYFEKTLPAIIAAMETSRLRQRADIIRRLREDDIVQYPLEQAFADLGNYQLAASLDGAIEQITTAAGQRAAVAVQEYANATDSCNPTEAVGNQWGRLTAFAYSLSDGAFAATIPTGDTKDNMLTDLATIVRLMSGDPTVEVAKATTKAEAETQVAKIQLTGDDYCSESSLKDLFDAIEAATERKIS